jgi:hypothetical protein
MVRTKNASFIATPTFNQHYASFEEMFLSRIFTQPLNEGISNSEEGNNLCKMLLGL